VLCYIEESKNMKREEIEKINKLRSLFPTEIDVSVSRSELGKY
jgi:hypothetical protein